MNRLPSTGLFFVMLLALLPPRPAAPAEPSPPADDPACIYGMHDPGGEQHMLDAGTPGWIVFTEAIGADPDKQDGRDYSPWTSRGLGALVRLNYGYGPLGTLPFEKDYDAFARRAAGFVGGSTGARRWIIGNETNLRGEWPQKDAPPEPITPARYVACFRKCRTAIRALPGHGKDEVIVQGLSPWNTDSGDWIAYFKAILDGLGADADGIALHTYTHGHDPARLASDERMKAPYAERYFDFRAYIDFMRAVPPALHDRPVYITETDPGEKWEDANNGWVRAAYGEIDRWNRETGTQKIHALCLYRWPAWDPWVIENKPKVIEDWKQAMAAKCRWRP